MEQICPLCGVDDDVESVTLCPELFDFTCANSGKHPGGRPWTWEGTVEGKLSGKAGGVGLMHDLGMLNQLTACVLPGEPWVEYGIVEDRYRQHDPDAFEQLRQEFGHRILGPTKNPHFTASAYIARVLGMLRDQGQLAFQFAKATGDWSYNGTVSYWALPPAPPATDVITFEEYAERSS